VRYYQSQSDTEMLNTQAGDRLPDPAANSLRAGKGTTIPLPADTAKSYPSRWSHADFRLERMLFGG
jgi:hypothetical protein